MSGAPRLTIVAGPNGAGKSTLTQRAGLRGALIDPDAIARTINRSNPEAAAVQAGREALRRADQYIATRKDFIQETTMSGSSTGRLVDKAKAAGYEVELRYVGVETAMDSKSRVAERVALGGHNIPSEDIERRWQRSMDALPRILAKADRATLYDNSGTERHREVMKVEAGQVVSIARNRPAWLETVATKLREVQSEAATASYPEITPSLQRGLAAIRDAGESTTAKAKAYDALADSPERLREMRLYQERARAEFGRIISSDLAQGKVPAVLEAPAQTRAKQVSDVLQVAKQGEAASRALNIKQARVMKASL